MIGSSRLLSPPSDSDGCLKILCRVVGGGEELAGWRQRIGERESGGGRLLRGQLGLFRVTNKLI